MGLNNGAIAPMCIVLFCIGTLNLQGCGKSDDDASSPIAIATAPPQVKDWKDFTSAATQVTFKVPTSAQSVHDNNQMMLVMYIDDGCQLSISGMGIGPDPEKAREFVAKQVVEDTTDKAIVAPPRDYPLKGTTGTYWADKIGNTKRKHRLLFAHGGWFFEVSADCDGDSIPDSLKPLFDSITLPAATVDTTATKP